MRGAATLAIARTRLRRELWPVVGFWLMCGLAAYVQRYDEQFAQLAGALLFGTIAASAAALLLRDGRHRDLTLCELAAPLYGRELARARAIVAWSATLPGTAIYWAVIALFARLQGGFVAISLAFACACASAMLCATASRGLARALYAAFVCALGVVCFALSTVPAAALVICALAAFLTLRQYGESIARG